MAKEKSPCLTCKRVACPRDCENKRCTPWREWWLAQWAKIHRPKKEEADS